MGLFEVSEAKKKAKEIKKEGKAIRKELLAAGMEKKAADSFLEEFLVCMENGWCLQDNYKKARVHMDSARQKLADILERMRDLPPTECKQMLESLLAELPQMYHICLIRKEDLDFDTTLCYLKKTVPIYGEKDRLMVQSELENLKALLDDTVKWDAPDFLALAYFLRHELFADMENSQRNSYIERIYKEKFWNSNEEALKRIGCKERIVDFAEQMLSKE